MTEQMVRTTHTRCRFSLLFAIVIALATPALHSQVTAPAAGTPARPIAAAIGQVKLIPFEVVSIRPSEPGRPQGDFFTDDGYTRRGITPQTLLTYMNKKQIGVPDWCFSERYDIVAKVAEDDLPAWKNMNFKQKSQAMRPMLEDRFKLKWHMETRMESGYELVIAKSGSKLKEPTADELDLRAKDPTPGHAVSLSASRGVGLTGFVGQAATMDLLTYYLQMFARAPVVDKTGLAGTYDFTLSAAPEPNPNVPAPSDPPISDAPSLFPAVQQQLGLKLVAGKVPVEYLVVDHIERPTAN
jgi:uncharacterized protein (TIGR03435 family)